MPIYDETWNEGGFSQLFFQIPPFTLYSRLFVSAKSEFKDFTKKSPQ